MKRTKRVIYSVGLGESINPNVRCLPMDCDRVRHPGYHRRLKQIRSNNLHFTIKAFDAQAFAAHVESGFELVQFGTQEHGIAALGDAKGIVEIDELIE